MVPILPLTSRVRMIRMQPTTLNPMAASKLSKLKIHATFPQFFRFFWIYLIIRTRFLSEILILRIILRHYWGLSYETTFTLFPAQSSGTKSWSSPISQKLFDKICLNKINFLWRLIPLSQIFNGNVTTQKLRCNVAGLHVNDL